MHYSIQGKLKCWATLQNLSYRSKPWQVLIRNTWSIIPTQKPVTHLDASHRQHRINLIRKWGRNHTDSYSEKLGRWMQPVSQYGAFLTFWSEHIHAYFFFFADFHPSLWVCIIASSLKSNWTSRLSLNLPKYTFQKMHSNPAIALSDCCPSGPLSLSPFIFQHGCLNWMHFSAVVKPRLYIWRS